MESAAASWIPLLIAPFAKMGNGDSLRGGRYAEGQMKRVVSIWPIVYFGLSVIASPSFGAEYVGLYSVVTRSPRPSRPFLRRPGQ
jgi:hypothetical protein